MRKKEIGSVARGFLVLVLLPTLVMAGCGKKEGRSGNQARESTPAASAEGAPCQASEEVAAALPRVVDLGRGICIPCKQMAPILKELAETYKGRAVIEVIDIGEPEGREMANRWGLRVIPTQIFFDSEGIEVWRHEGFLPREDIVAKLREMGVEEP